MYSLNTDGDAADPLPSRHIPLSNIRTEKHTDCSLRMAYVRLTWIPDIAIGNSGCCSISLLWWEMSRFQPEVLDRLRKFGEF